MKILLCQPGPSFAVQDVFAGLDYGLQAQNLMVMPYRLDQRIIFEQRHLKFMWKVKRKKTKDLPKPSQADVLYAASVEALNIALNFEVDAVVVVSAMVFHPKVLVMMKRAGLKVYVLFTESPYDDKEILTAGLKDHDQHVLAGCWTTERTSLAEFKRANPKSWYLPHAWHPEKHRVAPVPDSVPQHDVVFVGSGFSERIDFLNAMNWDGIDLGLYGDWTNRGLKPELKPCIRDGNVSNDYASALYRSAKIGLNLYRHAFHAESLNPRAYELAACGAFHLSEYRAEVSEKFGSLVPTFRTPAECESLIREWLNKPIERRVVSTALPISVKADSWIQRAGDVLAAITPEVMACAS